MKLDLILSSLAIWSLANAHPVNLKRAAEAVAEANPIDWNTVNYGINWATVNYAKNAAVQTQAPPPPPAPKPTPAPPPPPPAPKAAPVVQNNNQQKNTTPKPSNNPPKKDSGSGSSSGSASGKSWGSNSAIAFSQYKPDNTCKSPSQLANSIKALSSYSVLRLYDVDCDLVKIALKNKKKEQKLLVGIYDPTKVSDGVKTIKKAVSEAGASWSNDIYGVTVGNEHVNDGRQTAGAMAGYVQSAKKQLGNGVLVAAVDVYAVIAKNTELCKGDFVAANAHPYFDQSTSYDKCGSWLQSQISMLKSKCNTDKILITETGWPTQDSNGNKASSSNQKSCLKSISSSSIKNQVTLFSAWDEKWKKGVLETHWGINGADPNV